MQETKGCCGKCHIYLDYKDSHQCNNSDCLCHNSSDAFIDGKINELVLYVDTDWQEMEGGELVDILPGEWLRTALKEAIEHGMEKEAVLCVEHGMDRYKEGANEFKQKVLEAIKEVERQAPYNFVTPTEIRTLISNLEV